MITLKCICANTNRLRVRLKTPDGQMVVLNMCNVCVAFWKKVFSHYEEPSRIKHHPPQARDSGKLDKAGAPLLVVKFDDWDNTDDVPGLV